MTDHTDADALLGRIERIVAKATARGADQAEVYWSRDVELGLDIENNAVASTGRARREGGGLRVIKDGRVGFAYLTSEDEADRTIDQALRLSELAPAKSMRLPGPESMPSLEDRWDPEIAALDTAMALDLATRLLDVRKDQASDTQFAGGGVQLGWSIEAIANSEGVAVADRSTGIGAGVNLVMQDGSSALNMWDSENMHRGQPDAEALLLRVAADLRSLRSPQAGPVGDTDVVFRPDAVIELLSGLVVSAVDGDDAMRGKTVWSDQLGEAVADANLDIVDDPLRPGAIGVGRFDGDGLPAQRTPILEGGVLRNFLFDVRDGAEHGKASTHSGVRSSFKSPPMVGTQHLVVDGPSMPDAKLISGVDDGYVIESVLGAHTANATTGDFSVTAPNAWRVKGGEVVGAAKEIAIGGSLKDLLHRFDGLGDQPKRMDGALVPMLRFRDVHVSA